jgi:hypothetical protein
VEPRAESTGVDVSDQQSLQDEFLAVGAVLTGVVMNTGRPR